MKKYGPLLTLFLFLVLSLSSAAWGQTGETGTVTDEDTASYDEGTGGASQPETAPIAYPPEMADPAPVYTGDLNAPATADSPADSSVRPSASAPAASAPGQPVPPTAAPQTEEQGERQSEEPSSSAAAP